MSLPDASSGTAQAAGSDPVDGRLDAEVRIARDASGADGREAFGLLFDAYHHRVLRFCLRRVGRMAADDVASEAWLAVANEIRRFAGHTETDFRCWLYRVAANRANAYLRKTLRRGELLAEAAGELRVDNSDDPTRPMESADDWGAVRAAIGRLNEREQTIVTLRSLEGLPYEEVAAAVGVRVNTARTAHSRALARLRGWLDASPTPATGQGVSP